MALDRSGQGVAPANVCDANQILRRRVAHALPWSVIGAVVAALALTYGIAILGRPFCPQGPQPLTLDSNRLAKRGIGGPLHFQYCFREQHQRSHATASSPYLDQIVLVRR